MQLANRLHPSEAGHGGTKHSARWMKYQRNIPTESSAIISTPGLDDIRVRIKLEISALTPCKVSYAGNLSPIGSTQRKVFPLGPNRVSKGWAREVDGHSLIWRFLESLRCARHCAVEPGTARVKKTGSPPLRG